MLRKDRVLEILRAMCAEAATPDSEVQRGRRGFSAEEVAERAAIDRTNASRDLNQLVQDGKVERIPGRPVRFVIKEPAAPALSDRPPQGTTQQETGRRTWEWPQLVRSEAPNRQPAVVASMRSGAIVTSFETLIGADEGLKVAIQQAKAAMLYPPHGLHTLICGPSGVGKTTFARLMHAFAVEFGALPPTAPFVAFNCADYAGNPQLLMAHLFGVVRGAYTGAERDRPGLVEQANGGILFLDEVHRLPPEGQEMLFYLMDRERFRRLGDLEERSASILLIAATTEDPNTTLLPTFRRRVPMQIVLPGLTERSMHERYALIRAFFTTECSSIDANIHVAPQVIQALLLYECPGNIGQLRTDIQLLCARAYLDYRTHGRHGLSELYVDVSMLPDHVRRGLLRTAELQRSLEPLLDVLKVTHIFTPTGLNLDVLPHSARDLYDTISQEVGMLRRSGLSDSEVNRLLQLEIQHYFQRFAAEVTRAPQESVPHLVDERVAAACRGVVDYAAQRLERELPEKLALVLALHITSTLEHLAQGRQVPAVIESVAAVYPREYEIARTALAQLRSALQAPLPESEIDVLAVLLAHADTLLSSTQPGVGIVVAAHGRGVAAGLAELANTLVGVRAVRWVELSLEQSPDELVAQVASWVRVADQGAGVLLLVDFVSLLSLSELVEQQTGVRVRTVSDVSAPLVIEAVRRAQRSRDLSLDQLAESLTLSRSLSGRDSLGGLSEKRPASQLATTTRQQPGRVILSVCLTGFGSAAKIAELIGDYLPGLHQQGIEILCMDITLSYKTQEDIRKLVGSRQVIAVVGTINPHLDDYPFLPLTDLLFGDGLARLRTLLGETLIDPALLQPEREGLPAARLPEPPATSPAPPTASDGSARLFTRRADLVTQLTETLSRRLIFLNPQRVMPLIDRMIELIEVEVGETFPTEVLAGLLLHLACILERGVPYKGILVSEPVRRQVEQQFPRELALCRHALQVLGTQVGRLLPDEEAYNIVCILRQLDIFAARV